MEAQRRGEIIKKPLTNTRGPRPFQSHHICEFNGADIKWVYNGGPRNHNLEVPTSSPALPFPFPFPF